MGRKNRNWRITRNLFLACAPTIIVAVLILIAGIIIFGKAISGIGSSTDCLDWWGGSDNPHAIETGGNLTLPASVDNLVAHSVAFQDCTVFISFDMNPAELDMFIASTYVEEFTPTQGTDLFTFKSWMGGDVPEWQFADDITYLYGTGTTTAETQYIVIDPNTDRYTVYVISFLAQFLRVSNHTQKTKSPHIFTYGDSIVRLKRNDFRRDQQPA